jgi:hypothetical protein
MSLWNFRIFIQTLICIYTGAEIKELYPPVAYLEGLGVGIYFLMDTFISLTPSTKE